MMACQSSLSKSYHPTIAKKATMIRFAEYEALGVPFILQMDPEDRKTHLYRSGDLLQRELTTLDIGDRSIPFDTQALYAKLDEG